MTESLSADDLAVGRLIRELSDAGARDRDAGEVARAVITRAGAQRPRVWLPFAVATGAMAVVGVAVAITLSATGLIQEDLRSATARTGGLTYTIAVGRSIDLSGADLTPTGKATQDSGFVTEDATAYQVDQIDPRQVLVMKLIPGEHDGAGSIGDYLLLIRGDGFSLLCDYWALGDPSAPTVCH